LIESAGALLPGCEPATDVAAAGNGGEIVEIGQNAGIGQALEGAEREGGTADPTARDAKGRKGRSIGRGGCIPANYGEFLGENFREFRQFIFLRHDSRLWSSAGTKSTVNLIDFVAAATAPSRSRLCKLLRLLFW